MNGDDGVIRGICAQTGKVVRKLQGDGEGEGEERSRRGHEAGSKVRGLGAGVVRVEVGEGDEGIEEEWVVSGGFDRRCVVWRTGEAVERERSRREEGQGSMVERVEEDS